MKKLMLLFLILGMLMIPNVLGTITSVTINDPPSTIETDDAYYIFNVSVVWTDPTNITNVSVWAGSTQLCTNSTVNGSRTSSTTGHFICNGTLSGLSEGLFSLIAEARNDTSTSNLASSKNSSSQNFRIDRSSPTCSITISKTKLAPFKQIEVDCSRSSDTNTINTSTYNLYVEDSGSSRTTDSDETDGIAEFSGATTSVKGEYTAGCNVTDNAGNIGACSEETFFVKDDDDEIITVEEKEEEKEINMSLIVFSFLALVVVVVLIIVLIWYLKNIEDIKKKKKKKK